MTQTIKDYDILHYLCLLTQPLSTRCLYNVPLTVGIPRSANARTKPVLLYFCSADVSAGTSGRGIWDHQVQTRSRSDTGSALDHPPIHGIAIRKTQCRFSVLSYFEICQMEN